MTIEDPTLRIGFALLMVIGGVGTALLVFTVLARVVIQYGLDQRAFSVKLFGVLPMVRIRYEDIVDVRVVSGFEATKLAWRYVYSTLRLGNRLTGKGVFITRKALFLKRIAITPDTPEQFVAEILNNARAAAKNAREGCL